MKKKLTYLIPLFCILLSGCSHSSNNSSKKNTGTTTIEIYATNDIHGQIYSESGRTGLGNLMTFLKVKGEQDNTLLLDQGDTWQGSIYSNYNHGELITDVMNYIQYDARSVGNHDFDWGTEYLAKNTAKSYYGYSTPVLAGNVYDYDMSTHTFGNNQQSDLGVKSVTYTLENGVKVGILGGIGEDQITSICSVYTTEIGFKNHVDFIKEEATHLRQDENCDVVIASIHAPQSAMLGNGLESYVDLVLCGHSHVEESTNEGKLYYSQNKAYTQSCGHITLTYSFEEKDVIDTNIECISAAKITANVDKVDSQITNIINSYVEECDEEATKVVANNVSGSFYSSGEMANLMCRAIYDECIKEGYSDVLLASTNQARASKYTGSWTYADLYQAFPFDNTVYIAEVTGSEFVKEFVKVNKGYIFIYRGASFTDTSIDYNKTYKVAIIDYVYFHTNSNRYYDYFAETGGSSTVTLSKNYREILRDWLISNEYNTGKKLSSSDFSSSLWQHDRNQLPS